MNEIELYSKIQNPIDAIERVGTFFAKSGMFGCDRVEQGMVLAMACMTERMSPIVIKRKYHLQQGELSMRADAMLAEFRSKLGGKHKIIARTPERAAVELTLDGQTVLFSFTWAEAEKEPFVYTKDGRSIKKNYATPRARTQMLWARVISEGVHTMAPEIVSGTYTPEELADEIPAAETKDLLPAAASAAPAALIPADPKPAQVTEVRTVTDTTNEPVTPAAPVQTPAPAPTPKEINWSNPKDPKKISPEGAQAIADAIGNAADQEMVLRWLEANKWILPSGSLLDLTPQRALSIHKDTAKFVQFVRNGGKKG